MSEVELFDRVGDAAELSREWEALAVAGSKPVASAAWVLAWWRHVAPAGTLARLVAVREHGRLIGVAPFYLAASRGGVAEYRLMAADFGVSMEPLALPGREWDVAAAVAGALATQEPAPAILRFGPMPAAAPWADALAAATPGPLPALVRRTRMEGAPVVLLREPDYEQWFATLSSKLRRDLRRSERAFVAAGGTVRWADAATLPADAAAFARLHAGRWEARGWSRLADLGERLERWLIDVGEPLIAERRIGLCVLELDGEAICVDLSLSAGAEVSGINVGWDERHAKLAPAKLSLLSVIADAHEKGASRVSLGNGALSNKVRIANGDDPVAWTSVLPVGARLPLAYARLAPELARARARELLGRTLPEPWLEGVRGAAGRLRR